MDLINKVERYQSEDKKRDNLMLFREGPEGDRDDSRNKNESGMQRR